MRDARWHEPYKIVGPWHVTTHICAMANRAVRQAERPRFYVARDVWERLQGERAPMHVEGESLTLDAVAGPLSVTVRDDLGPGRIEMWTYAATVLAPPAEEATDDVR